MNQHLFTAQCIDLLAEFLNDAREAAPSENPPIQQVFVYRHANNIATLADDVHSLRADDRIGSCFILMRSLFEGLMNLVAAVKCPSFAAEKMISEIEHDIDKVTKWQDAEQESEAQQFAEPLELIKDLAQSLRHVHGITSQRRWTTLEVARLAGLDQHYMHELFLFSRNAHASTGGIIAQEHDCGQELILQDTSYIALSALAHAVQVLPSKHAQHYVHQATRLLEFLNEEAMKNQANNAAYRARSP